MEKHSCQKYPYEELNNHQREINKCTVEQLYLKQMIKINITNKEQPDILCLWI